MTALAPLETRYRGYRFRSRLEARWAVLLHSLGVRWQYEPEGFDLDSVWYLPDFWIGLNEMHQRPYPQGVPPECGFWLEIKPTQPDQAAQQKCAALSVRTGHNVYLAAGNVGPGEFEAWKWSPRAGGPFRSSMDPERELYPDNNDALSFYLLFEAAPEGATYSDLEEAYSAARSERFDGRERPVAEGSW